MLRRGRVDCARRLVCALSVGEGVDGALVLRVDDSHLERREPAQLAHEGYVKEACLGVLKDGGGGEVELDRCGEAEGNGDADRSQDPRQDLHQRGLFLGHVGYGALVGGQSIGLIPSSSAEGKYSDGLPSRKDT